MAPRSQLCPLCRVTYAHLPQHLLKLHGVANREERILLLQLSSGRVKGEFQCQVPNCMAVVKRLDRHIIDKHGDLPFSEVEELVSKAKKKYILKKLAELRATNPNIPMASFLDKASSNVASSSVASINVASSSVASRKVASSSVDPMSPPMMTSTPAGPSKEVEEEEEDMVVAGPSTSGMSAESVRSCSCTDQLCIKEKQVMREQIDRLMAQIKCSGGECRNPDCVYQAAELQKYVTMFMESPNMKARKKFSRRDFFKKAENPKYEKILQQFLRFCTGCNPSAKKTENTKTAVSHVRRFLIFAGQGCLLRGDFAFLKNASCIASWVDMLQDDGYKPTTVRIQLLNLKKFLKYLLHLSNKETKLNGMDYRRIMLELEARIKDLSRDVITHRQKIRKAQSKNIMPKADSRAFRKGVKGILPKKIKKLETNPSWHTLEQVYGLLTGYFICVSGHRKGVLQNLTVAEVMDAEEDGDHVLIEVSHHKSASTYGHAQLSLNQEEYSWFTSLLRVRKLFESGSSEYFFFNRSGGMHSRLLELFQTEWSRMGLGGRYTFKNVRTSIVHHTKNITPKKKQQINRLMCHSEAVASRFYTTLSTASEAAQVRRLQVNDSSGEDDIRPSRKKTRKSTSTPPVRRCLELDSSSSEEEEGVREEVIIPETQLQSMSESEDESGAESLVESIEEGPEDPVFVLESPPKAPQTSDNMQVIGLDPSPGHAYLGRPFQVSQDQMCLLKAKTSPRVKVTRVDEPRNASLPLVVYDSSSEEDVEESEVVESLKF